MLDKDNDIKDGEYSPREEEHSSPNRLKTIANDVIINEPSNGFFVSDAMIFLPPAIMSNDMSASNQLIIGLIIFQALACTATRATLSNAKFDNKEKLLGLPIEDLDAAPFFVMGATHLGLTGTFLSQGHTAEAAVAACLGTGDLILSIPPKKLKNLKETISENFKNAFNASSNPEQSPQIKQAELKKQSETTASFNALREEFGFGKAMGKIIKREAEMLSYAPFNSNTWFAGALGTIAFMSDWKTALAAIVPYAIGVSYTAKNVNTQFRDNLPFAPTEGKPLLWFGATTGAMGAVNGSIEIARASGLMDIPVDRTETEAITGQFLSAAQVLIAGSYIRLSTAFEGLKLPKIIPSFGLFKNNNNDDDFNDEPGL